MGEVALILLGVVLGIAGDEGYAFVKKRLDSRRQGTVRRRLATATDPVRHAANLGEIFGRHGLADHLFRPATTQDTAPLPLVHDAAHRFVGDLPAASDGPLRLTEPDRVDFPYDQAVIEQMRRGGVELWDGSLLYSVNDGPLDGALPVGVCNYFAYVDLCHRVLRESDKPKGEKPYLLGSLRTFDDAICGVIRPLVIAATATCVFDDGSGGLETAIQRRSPQVVVARGMYAAAPVFGLESNVIGRATSRFGIVTYNVLKEILEEYFDEPELTRAGDHPAGAHPDWIFRTEHGRRLVDEVDAGRILLRCTGAAIDVLDGSLVLAVLAQFTSPEYAREVKLSARGSWESDHTSGPRIEFVPLHGLELEARMSIETMTASSIYSLDRAREYLRPRDARPGPEA
ncbi:hypothetical protein E1212_14485 [Jiangella ureilytica]|uniref:Uncharacterized protein n=1 Tax=Jiangella ureilytica TaxID=2530374 RepID=A0A4R4RLL8_9ACTN|nr:hypothetical protein [Jiangella ureilytica]TDC50578.1 hypothetical protein E1212_14485 [Jiangella ureilytica]